MTVMSKSCSVVVYGFVAAFLAIPTYGHCEEVGAAAAVKPSSTGTAPGGTARKLQIGATIASQERIETNNSGSLQVMFLDKTTLTIGPNSNLVIDQFVYDTGGGVGQFAANLTKGAVRFVGGQISHTAGATINTPSATVGIRGGAAMIKYGPCNELSIGSKLPKSGSGRLQDVDKSGNCTQVLNLNGKVTVKSLVGSAKSVVLERSQATVVGLGNFQAFTVEVAKPDSVATGGAISGGNQTNQNNNNSTNNVSGNANLTASQAGIQEPVPPPAPPSAEGPPPPPQP